MFLLDANVLLHAYNSSAPQHVLGPGLHHASLLRDVAMRHQIAGPRMTDAVLVALALEHDAVLVSSDRGFGNFPELKWINPLES